MEDLSDICYVDFPVESNYGKATMKVKNEHLKMWNVDAKEMFQQARANTPPILDFVHMICCMHLRM